MALVENKKSLMNFLYVYRSMILIVIFCIARVGVNGQVSYGGRPYPYEDRKAYSHIVKMPLFDYNLVRSQLDEEKTLDGRKPLPVAWNYEVNLNPYNSGNWHRVNDTTRLWRLEIQSDNAYALNVFFNEFALEKGVRVFLYDPAQTHIRGSFDHRSNKPSGSFPVSFIPGEKIIVELQVPWDMPDFGRLNIGVVGHAFADIFGSKDRKDGQFGKSGDCNVDINCPAGDEWQVLKRAVCRIIFISGLSQVLCTGTLINNTAIDGKPYLLTANHCINKSKEAESAIFYFGYESPECDGTDGSIENSLAHSVIKATSDSLDFSLLLLSEEPPDSYNPYFAGWTISDNPAPSSVCIHHPMGDVKKITIDEDPVTSQYQADLHPTHWLFDSTPNGFWRVIRWNIGVTENGSSGAPLLNNNGLIVGNLTGGDADCSNPVNDYFSKFHLCWDYYPLSTKRLKPWLDENTTGRTVLPGYDPFFEPDTTSTIMDLLVNSPQHTGFASAIMAAGLQDLLSAPEPLTVFAPVDEAFGSLIPGTMDLLFSEQNAFILEVVKNHIINSEVFSVDLFNGQKLDALSGREINISVNENGLFYDYGTVISSDMMARNGIVHYLDEVILPIGQVKEQYHIFPNPAVDDLWIYSENESLKGARIRLYDLNGSLLADYPVSEEKLVKLNGINFPAGIYIIEILNNRSVFRTKMMFVKPDWR